MQTQGMWNKKMFGGNSRPREDSGFYSSGFYGGSDSRSESPSSQFQASAAGVLPPSERVGGVQPQKLSDSVVRLVTSIQSSEQFDALRITLKLADWMTLAEHLQPFSVEVGQEVIRQGATESSVYIVESGQLNVTREDATGVVLLSRVGAGSVIGEGAFFSRMPRSASVQAVSRGVLWGLTPMRYAELAHRYPHIALSFVMALGGVVTRRMTNKPKRGAVT
jgi:CRP/FNR family transcriptional regulator, cyclic AMP receptor protein